MDKLIAKIAVASANYQIDKPYDYIVPEEFSDEISSGMRVIVPFSRSNRKTEGIVLSLYKTSDCGKLKSIFSLLDKAPVLSDELLKLALWMRERFFCTVYEAVKAMLPSGIWYSLNSVCRIADGVSREEAYDSAGHSEKQRLLLDVLYAHGGNCEYRDLEIAFGGSDIQDHIRRLSSKGIIIYDKIETRRINDKTIGFATLCISVEEALDIAVSKKRAAPSQAAVLKMLADYGGATVADIRYLTGAGNNTIKRLEQSGLICLEQIDVFRRPEYREGEKREIPKLSQQQKAAFDGILSAAGTGRAGAALLYGITGSGKTSVYVCLIDELLKQGKSTILLVPEIALTPQMLETFSSYFGDAIAVVHSSLSAGERYDEWKRIKSGAAKVVIGTRSAVFAPVQNLGMIIIDEEHEDTYKSENAPRYHARDVAKFRCSKNNALLLLGSATPDIVSMYNARIGKYSLFSISERFNRKNLPQVRIVDMKREIRNGNGGNLSSVLIKELEENILRGEQSILFLNRRGTSKLISCGECGFTYKCPRCSVSLTYHSANGRLMCHYCGYSQPAGVQCPECGGRLNFTGAGTQKIEDELSSIFPEIEIIRMDTDTVSGAGSHDLILSRFRDEKIPILIGTQMVTKGLDFPNVTLVGVISADQSLYSGDYRSSERTFSLITQVVGRSGRGDVPGRAVIQTFTPENQVIKQAAAQDYDGFYNSELEMRRLQWCPPFSDLFYITAVGQNETDVLRCLSAAKKILEKELIGKADVRILGPAPFFVVRVNNRFRYRLILSCKDEKIIRELISNVIIYCTSSREFKGVTVYGDINANQ